MSHLKTIFGRIAAAFVGMLLIAGTSRADTTTIHIGATETFVEENVPEDAHESAVEDVYRQFVQGQTGFRSDIVALENHEVLAERLASGKLQLGFFMGYEFAWAQARHPKLKVLAVAVNQHSYRYPTLVVRRDGPSSDLVGLKGTRLALPRRGQGYARLFVAAQSRLAGLDSAALLGHIDSFEDAETPLDEIVDGTRQAAVVDRLGLEVYQRRKPGRSIVLQKLAESPPMPPDLIAYYDGKLDPQTLTRLREGLTQAHKQKRAEMFLTLFRLTTYAEPSGDFERVLADTRKAHPSLTLKKMIVAHSEADGPRLVVTASNLIEAPRQQGPAYYVSVFAFESVPRRSQYSHTFATFIKSSGDSVEAHTISWLPKSMHVEIARTQSEPGINLDLHQTLEFARGISARVYQWGPYRIRPELYERSLRQIERLGNGRMQYKALDGAWRPDAASNCIHAVSDIVAFDGYLTVDGACGVPASARVVEHLSAWMIQPGREHPSIQEKLRLSGQPITRVAWSGERPAFAASTHVPGSLSRSSTTYAGDERAARVFQPSRRP